MKKILSLSTILYLAQIYSSFAQEQKINNNSLQHGLCFEFWGTSNTYNLQYLLLNKIRNSDVFYQTDAIAGYRPEKSGKNGIIHVYNFSMALNVGYLHKTGRSLLLGCGLGYDRGRIGRNTVNPKDETNKSIVTYIRINYARRVSNKRIILGISIIYGFKIKEYHEGNDPDFNARINEFQNWFAPAVSIGYCFGKKYFQKDKIGKE